MELEYSRQLFEKYSDFMKILLEAELFHADARTDMMKLKVAFRDFANAPKKGPEGL
jgi:hypothetical protein